MKQYWLRNGCARSEFKVLIYNIEQGRMKLVGFDQLWPVILAAFGYRRTLPSDIC